MKIDESNNGIDWNELHFVLVHGGSHGGWCWYKLRTLLEAEGHKVTAVDLTSAGIDSTSFCDVLSFSQYNNPLTTFMDSLSSDEKVVIVGHSIGGLNVTDVLYKFPEKILVAVYIAANMMKEGYGLSQMQIDQNNVSETRNIDILALLNLLFGALINMSQWDVVIGPNNLPGIIMKPEFQRSNYYNMCPVEASTLAASLLRPCPVAPLLRVTLNPTEGGLSVPRVFVRTLNDNMMSQSSQQDMITNWPPSKVYAIGSDHSAMISTPTQLARILIESATYAQQKS